MSTHRASHRPSSTMELPAASTTERLDAKGGSRVATLLARLGGRKSPPSLDEALVAGRWPSYVAYRTRFFAIGAVLGLATHATALCVLHRTFGASAASPLFAISVLGGVVCSALYWGLEQYRCDIAESLDDGDRGRAEALGRATVRVGIGAGVVLAVVMALAFAICLRGEEDGWAHAYAAACCLRAALTTVVLAVRSNVAATRRAYRPAWLVLALEVAANGTLLVLPAEPLVTIARRLVLIATAFGVGWFFNARAWRTQLERCRRTVAGRSESPRRGGMAGLVGRLDLPSAASSVALHVAVTLVAFGFARSMHVGSAPLDFWPLYLSLGTATSWAQLFHVDARRLNGPGLARGKALLFRRLDQVSVVGGAAVGIVVAAVFGVAASDLRLAAAVAIAAPLCAWLGVQQLRWAVRPSRRRFVANASATPPRLLPLAAWVEQVRGHHLPVQWGAFRARRWRHRSAMAVALQLAEATRGVGRWVTVDGSLVLWVAFAEGAAPSEAALACVGGGLATSVARPQGAMHGLAALRALQSVAPAVQAARTVRGTAGSRSPELEGLTALFHREFPGGAVASLGPGGAVARTGAEGGAWCAAARRLALRPGSSRTERAIVHYAPDGVLEAAFALPARTGAAHARRWRTLVHDHLQRASAVGFLGHRAPELPSSPATRSSFAPTSLLIRTVSALRHVFSSPVRMP